MKLKQRVAQRVFDRYFRWRLERLTAPKFPILLDFPVMPEPRYGYGKPTHPMLSNIISRGTEKYRARLKSLLALTPLLDEIAGNNDPGAAEPSFLNMYYSGLDAIALMGLLAEFKPAILIEIGSGNSTRFARKSIRYHGLSTRIISCDPQPRAEIEALCDEVHRQPAETISPDLFQSLAASDILFIDSSHRVFQNSDVTMLVLEVLPALRSGVVVHFHDIYLPSDYPPEWKTWYFSEQYMIAAMLLANPDCMEILLPNAFVSVDPGLSSVIEPLWQRPGMQAARDQARRLTCGRIGNSWWLRIP